MGIAFSNDQIKNLTKDTLLLPFVINDPNTGYVAQKSLLAVTIGGLEKTDDGVKVFTDFYEGVQAKYHQELALLNNSQRTNYADADLLLAGNSSGPHYPEGWKHFTPYVIPSVVGNPTSVLTNNLEDYYYANLSFFIGTLKSGYSDSGFSSSVTISNYSFSSTNGLGSLAVNNRIVVSNGSGTYFAKVTDISTSESQTMVNGQPVTVTTTTATFIVTFGTYFDGNCSVAANAVGFSNSQRTGQSSTSPSTAWFTFLKDTIIQSVQNWENYINQIKAVLDSNPDLQPRKARILSASANCASATAIIDAWQVLADIAVNGKLSDTNLQPIIDLTATRASYTTARIAEVIADLGSVTQNADGTFTGTGVYGELFKNIDMRAAKGTGSLSALNGAALSVSFIDKKIATANDQLAQFNNTFAISKISSDTIVGQIDLEVESATEFQVNDTVKVMDNQSSVYDRTIASINGNVIRVNQGLPAELTVGNLARIVKLR